MKLSDHQWCFMQDLGLLLQFCAENGFQGYRQAPVAVQARKRASRRFNEK